MEGWQPPPHGGGKDERAMVENTRKPEQSDREAQHAAMLKEALERPGVREMMTVYRDWRQADSGLDPYRAATKEPLIITTTDHANAR